MDQRSRSELACSACGTAVPWEGEKFAVLRYVALSEGVINDALELLRHMRLGKLTSFGSRHSRADRDCTT